MNSIKPLYTYLDELDFESKTAQHAKYFGLDIMVYRQFVFGFLQKLYERIADESAQPENKPLTLDELRQMDGEPVWVMHRDGSGARWGIVQNTKYRLCAVVDDDTAYWFTAVCGTIAYRAKPKEEHHEVD